MTIFDINFDKLEANLRGATLDSGKYESGLQFDSQGDHVLIPATGSLSNLHNSDYSISFWINPDQLENSSEKGQLNVFPLISKEVFTTSMKSRIYFLFPLKMFHS